MMGEGSMLTLHTCSVCFSTAVWSCVVVFFLLFLFFFGKSNPCFHSFQSFSFIDDSNPGSPSSDISGLVAEPNLSGRSHTLIFSSSEVSGLLVAHSSLKPLQDDPCAAERGRSQACSLSWICECWGRRRKIACVCVCVWSRFVFYGNNDFWLSFCWS